VLRMVHADGRVVLAHDSDFGTLVITQDEPFTGIVYLCPGHIDPEFTIETLRTVAVQPLDVKPPFIVVAEQEARTVRIRLRHL
jgi:predicted nuclease of predicted toxin-antitoxin system